MQKKAVSPASKSKLPDRSDLALELLLKTYTSKKLNKNGFFMYFGSGATHFGDEIYLINKIYL